MALGEALMVLLAEQPLSGYNLAKTLDTPTGFYWRADHQQVYRELARLREQGFVAGKVVPQTGRPNKTVYALTHAGLEHLREWSRQPTSARDVKDDLLVRLHATDAFDLGLLRADLEQRLGLHRQRLAQYQKQFAQLFAARGPSLRQRGRLLGLRLAIRQEQGWVDWCTEALEFLPQEDELAGTPPAARPAASPAPPGDAPRPRRAGRASRPAPSQQLIHHA